MIDDQIIEAILDIERGYVNHLKDRGGATNWGITQATLTAWLGRPATIADVKALTREEAGEIYKALYITRPGFDKIQDPKLRHLVVDSGVQHGQARATKWLQSLLGVKVDGQLGPITAEAINRRSMASNLYNEFLAARIRYYGEIITGNPSQAVFAKGWMVRATSFLS